MNTELDFKLVGNRIQKLRMKQHLTQAALAEMIGTTQKHLSRIEAGYHHCKLDTAYAIAVALHVPLDALVADDTDSNSESTLKMLSEQMRGMSAKQLKMLRENIATIKKYDD